MSFQFLGVLLFCFLDLGNLCKNVVSVLLQFVLICILILELDVHLNETQNSVGDTVLQLDLFSGLGDGVLEFLLLSCELLDLLS